MTIAAQLIEAGKEYKTGESTIVALQPTTTEFRTGEITLLVGPSGSGKTTLLSLLGSVIYPSSGKVWVGDTCVNDLSEKELANLRLQHIGFVFQGFNLLVPLNALENVMEPLLLRVMKRKRRKKGDGVDRKFGMEDRIYNLPRNLSGDSAENSHTAPGDTRNILWMNQLPPSIKKAPKVMDMLSQSRSMTPGLIVVTHDVRLKNVCHRTIYVSKENQRNAMKDDF